MGVAGPSDTSHVNSKYLLDYGAYSKSGSRGLSSLVKLELFSKTVGLSCWAFSQGVGSLDDARCEFGYLCGVVSSLL